MSLDTVLARIAEIDSALAPPPPPMAAPPTTPATDSEFARVLSQAGLSGAAASVGYPGGLGVGAPGGAAALAAASGEVGQVEQPPGSNDSPRIAEYRAAVGGPVGPWCAYFVSWAAREGGVPLGDDGQGFASVDALYAWAQSSGRAVPAGTAPPSPGDLIVWDEHVGIVEAVLPDGTIRTVEGNSSDSVARRTYGSDGGGAIGYVRL